MIHKLLGARAAPLLVLALAAVHLQAQAIDLVEFTFGTGVGTTTAQTVAAHLAATPVSGRKVDGSVAPHSFVDLGAGNMAMRLLRSEGGYKFDFTLSADPGYTFQITDAHFAFRTQDTAGVNRNISVWPNADTQVVWYDAAGGDTIFNDMGPGGFGWKTANWTAFVTRDDLETLRVQLLLSGNSPNSVAIFDRVLLEGNVLAVPEPASALLFATGALGLWVARRRRSGA
ncbi:MAG: PEP-CTERM sorting domain-containing protein [Burkholderiaceae bacterium]|nr:PEP-CTERM sorting domain-containing protein [Burkholderiaceae bacterium]